MALAFDKSVVWQLSGDPNEKTHNLSKRFPKEELCVLTSQINRAAVSFSSNIAEGSTAQSNREFKPFLGYSARSGVEVVGCLYLAKREYITDESFKDLYDFLDSLIKKIQH